MVGLVIGKGGARIKQLMSQSGAKLVFRDTAEGSMVRPLRITGSLEAVETAKHLVTEVLANIDEGSRGNHPSPKVLVLCSVWPSNMDYL